jgi:hypothetical protein
MTQWTLQSPEESLGYALVWNELETGEGIEESTWTIFPDLGPDTGAGLDGLVVDTAGLTTQVIVSGLEAGRTYQLENVIRTNQDRVLSREITIRCANK